MALALSRARLPFLTLPPLRSFSTPSPPVGILEPYHTHLLPELPAPPRHSLNKLLVRAATAQLRHSVIDRYIACPPVKPSDSDAVQSAPPNLVLLDGPRGVGKSTLARQCVAHARARGYVVLYIPDARVWTRGGGFFAATTVEGKDAAKEGVGAVRWYDRPAQIGEVFEGLLAAHQEQLGEIVCREQLETEGTRGCASLLELVEMGKRFVDEVDVNWRLYPAAAGEVFGRLVRELAACEDQAVGIVIDGYEHFVGMTCMQNQRRHGLHADCIRVVAEQFGRGAIEKTAQEMANGFVMLTTDPMHPFEQWRRSRVLSTLEYPLSSEVLGDPSGRNWMQAFKERARESDDQMVLDVPELSNPELQAMCSTFVRGGLRNLVPDEQAEDAARLVALAGGRADIMRRIVSTR